MTASIRQLTFFFGTFSLAGHFDISALFTAFAFHHTFVAICLSISATNLCQYFRASAWATFVGNSDFNTQFITRFSWEDALKPNESKGYKPCPQHGLAVNAPAMFRKKRGDIQRVKLCAQYGMGQLQFF